MSKDKIKGGKADKMSIEDIAKKHSVSVESIKSQIEMGKKIEMEHVDSEKLAEEISMDHLDEIPDYYTRLNKMEKEAKKELNLEAKKFMALAGIKEGDKKFLANESFSEGERQLSRDQVNPDDWKGMDSMRMGTSDISSLDKAMDESKGESDFIVLEFDQEDVEPGHDDEELYKLK
jgi:hypothetical protein